MSRPQPTRKQGSANESEPAPLSFAQERFWLLQRLEPSCPAYNIPFGVRLGGRLNVTALEQSLNEIRRRHDVLRAAFADPEGRPVQIIAPVQTSALPVMDLQTLGETEREAEAQRLASEEARRPFDLARGPLLRTMLLRLRPDDHILLRSMHHIVADAWSVGVFDRELAVLYEAFSSGQASPLEELPVQYADFARWQRRRLQAERLESQLSYWKQQLGGSLPRLELPTDWPRPTRETYRGAEQKVELPADLTNRLRDVGRGQNAALFVTLLAAFTTLLFRYTGQHDILVGSPTTSRSRLETRDLIGPFLNTVVLRTDLSGDPSFRELLARVRDVTVAAFAHQDLPFEKVVQELRPARDLGRHPFFQIMLVMEPPSCVQKLRGLDCAPLDVHTGTAQFDLTVRIAEQGERLVVSCEYGTDLFEEATITRMLGHLRTLLNCVVANPDQRISHLPLLTDADLRQLLVEWNDTASDYPRDACIHELFEAQVERTPDAVAVICADEQLTYRELNARANQLAHYLQSLGVGPEILVGVCMERSLELVVGILAVLKAGGTYVPLDPAYPKNRLTFMMEDTHATVLLTQQELRRTLPESTARVVCLDTGWDAVAGQSEVNPTSSVRPDDLAYVIYTSGSTGQPKGVMISHRAIGNHLFWMQATFPLTAADRVSQMTSVSFDVSVWELLAPLLAGARVIMARPGGHQDSAYLVHTIAQHQVTVLQLVPSMLRALLEEPGFETCRCLRHIFCGGEVLPFELQQTFLARMNAGLHNLYGPTEASIDATCWTCRRDSPGPSVPIGRPVANTQIYLLDRHLQPVPVGVPGELFIGGAGLARGYWNRPELTAERFTPNPFSDEPGARLYKTGDLARYRPDGNIEFLGRADHQVKIRGRRIELEEIEAALRRHPAVRETAVLSREDGPGDKRLVAYVASAGQTTRELRSFLKEKLPEYMVPSGFVILDALPLLPSGKVDRRALPAPAFERPELQTTFMPPRTPVEEMVVKIWAEVLGLDRVGIHDDFFEMGGHSLLATRVISRVRTAFGVGVPLRRLFEAPTAAGLAGLVVEYLAAQTERDELAALLAEIEAEP